MSKFTLYVKIRIINKKNKGLINDYIIKLLSFLSQIQLIL